MKELITRVEKLNSHPTEAITLFYNMEMLSLDQLSKICEMLRGKFPDNRVIALPDIASLESCSKDVLENIISMITVIIEKL